MEPCTNVSLTSSGKGGNVSSSLTVTSPDLANADRVLCQRHRLELPSTPASCCGPICETLVVVMALVVPLT